MDEYLTPLETATSEFTEKRSTFRSDIFLVETEAEAKARLEEVRKKHHDARHHCWCYRLRNGLERYSDDGEPQGTAGQPMLNVFQRENVTNVVCVSTRYFGGILLGAGGLTRAYGRSAKDALDAAGISVVRPWTLIEAPGCPYPLFERLKVEVKALDGVEGDHTFSAAIDFRALMPQDRAELFAQRVQELSAGKVEPRMLGEQWKAVPLTGEGQHT